MINLVLDYINNQILYNDLRYTLTTNPYDIIYASKDGFIVKDLKTKTVFISFKDIDIAKSILEGKNFSEYIAYDSFINEILNDEPYVVFNVYHYPSNQKIKLDKEYDTHVLNDKEEIDYLIKHYDIYDEETLRQIVKTKSIIGLYENNKIIGFVGMHYEGSMGFLYIDDNFRHKGYGFTLEAILINKLIDEGKPVWGEVNINNKTSQSLQARIGMLKVCEQNVYWIRKDEKD